MAKTATAAYAPVLDALRDQIHDGDLDPGAWLPSESTIMRAHDVSRYTAREALKRLAAEGLITVVDGKGSYVRNPTARPTRSDTRALWLAPPTTPSGRPSKTGTPQVIDAETRAVERGGTIATRQTGWRQADVDLALALGIPEHTPVFTAERHHTTPEGAHVLYRLHLPVTTASRVPALKDDPDRTPDQLYAILDRAKLSPRWTETVRATTPTADDTTALDLAPGAIVLITRRTTHTPDGTVLTMEETRRNATGTQLSYPLTPTEPPATTITGPSRTPEER